MLMVWGCKILECKIASERNFGVGVENHHNEPKEALGWSLITNDAIGFCSFKQGYIEKESKIIKRFNEQSFSVHDPIGY